MVLNTGTARAKVSCSRCHKRKKRCDRFLPGCGNCRSARVKCSFFDDDLQNASYPIAYVQGLERRLREMEQRLSPIQPISPIEGDSTVVIHNDETLRDPSVHNHIISSPDRGTFLPMINDERQSVVAPPYNDLQLDAGPQERAAYFEPAIQKTSPTFDEELKSISLSVTAERHLGSTSGLSFAKLTQMVLRRLTPDKADFVFCSTDGNQDTGLLFDFDASFDFSSPSIFEHFNESIPRHPNLFGDIWLADTLEPIETTSELSLPTDDAYVNRLVNFYFAHSHTLYPVLIKEDFLRTLHHVREDPANSATQCPLTLFRIWMVFAIGSTAYSSVYLMEESESRAYYSKALEYSEQAMASGDMAALEVIVLQVSYSFFNQVGPNTWFLIGMAARLAIGIGLHTEGTYANWPSDVQQHRKRVFYSIYMMDRVISLTLGRPFALSDDDIDVTPFENSEEIMLARGGQPEDLLAPSPMTIPLHILSLRTIAGKIAKQVYSVKRSSTLTMEERENILHSLHKELIDWRRRMPFPLPNTSDRVPQFTTNWYDFNYYNHVAVLYRPSSLFPIMDEKRVKVLEEAASMALRQAFNMHRQQRLAYNWLNLLTIFNLSLSRIYAITVQPSNLITALRETSAIEDLDLSIELFDTLGIKFSAAKKIRGMIAEVSRRYKDLSASV